MDSRETALGDQYWTLDFIDERYLWSVVCVDERIPPPPCFKYPLYHICNSMPATVFLLIQIITSGHL